MSNIKGKAERVRVRGKNHYDVINQIVQDYNSSQGWALVKVVPSVLNLDVYLERNSTQGDNTKDSADEDEKVSKEEVKKTEQEDEVEQDVVDEKATTPTPKKTPTKKVESK